VHRTFVLVNIFHHRSLGNGYCDCTY
jgi:hypothetical protein